ncbi:hypothetical protein KS4_33770 [Poriferisphaera corsica]|uniref:Ice-binding protein C-terminal domain-containing protein n=2 Tax=Poriferisphaera corsica TaxID=2528020 RepID=A0A517YYJ4_9BACT|nr:hypothetical protein KS4_33770 [Poriferisphaera corsica]
MKSFGFLRYSLITVFAFGLVFSCSNVYAGIMLEFDYISQGKDAEEQAVEGGKAWGDAHFYLLGGGPNLEQLALTHSVRVSAWRSDQSGNASKHLGSIVTDLQDTADNFFSNSVSRINVIGDSSTWSLYANVDFHDDAQALQSIDEFAEGLFERVTGQKGKGILGWALTNAIKGVLKLAGVDLFSTLDWDAYLPENNVYEEYALASTGNLNLTSVPEPASFALLGLGGLMMLRRRH